MLLFVKVERQIDDFGVVVDVRKRDGSEIDVAVDAVELGVVLDGLANLADVEDIALLQRENRLKILALEGKALSRDRRCESPAVPCDTARPLRWEW